MCNEEETKLKYYIILLFSIKTHKANVQPEEHEDQTSGRKKNFQGKGIYWEVFRVLLGFFSPKKRFNKSYTFSKKGRIQEYV